MHKAAKLLMDLIQLMDREREIGEREGRSVSTEGARERFMKRIDEIAKRHKELQAQQPTNPV